MTTIDRDVDACLILHGLGGGPYEAGPLIEAIRGTGLDIEVPTYPGHEGPGPRMPSSTWQEWSGAAVAAFDRLAASHRAVAVAGFSTGGTIALHLAAMRPVARLAPFLAIRHRWYYGARPEVYLETLGRLFQNVPRRRACIRDPIRRAEVERVIPYRTFSLEAARSSLALIRVVRLEVPRITTPTLIVQSRLDSVVDPEGARWLASNLGTPEADRAILWLDRSDHLVVFDFEREAVIARVLEWFDLRP